MPQWTSCSLKIKSEEVPFMMPCTLWEREGLGRGNVTWLCVSPILRMSSCNHEGPLSAAYAAHRAELLGSSAMSGLASSTSAVLSEPVG